MSSLGTEQLANMMPQSVQEFMYVHGQEVANGIALSRMVTGPIIGALTLAGYEGVGLVSANLEHDVGDKLDGIFAFLAAKNPNHEEGHIKTFSEALAFHQKLQDEQSLHLPATMALLGHEANISRLVLRSINGAWLDQFTDKFGQWTRLAPLLRSKKVGLSSFATIIARDGFITKARQMYDDEQWLKTDQEENPLTTVTAIPVVVSETLDSVEKKKTNAPVTGSGQFKTTMMALGFAFAASKMSGKNKKITRQFGAFNAALSVYSGMQSITSYEAKAAGIDIKRLFIVDRFEVCVNGITRTMRYIKRKTELDFNPSELWD
jgi:phosphatidylglycerophosphate synthase